LELKNKNLNNMKTKNNYFAIPTAVFLSLAVSMNGMAQVFTTFKATSLVNQTVTAPTPKSSHSSLVVSGPAVSVNVATYPKKLTISYQIPAVNALEWNNLRIRSIDAVDSNLAKYWESPADVRAALDFLSFANFVKASSYGPLYVTLDFRFNSVTPYKVQHYRTHPTSPVLISKTMTIRR
jgi:hypothetical protein